MRDPMSHSERSRPTIGETDNREKITTMTVTYHGEQPPDAPHALPRRRLPVGAEVLPEGGVHFRVWASKPRRVDVVLDSGPDLPPGTEPLTVALRPEGDGYFSGLVAEAGAGRRYRSRLDGEGGPEN